MKGDLPLPFLIPLVILAPGFTAIAYAMLSPFEYPVVFCFCWGTILLVFLVYFIRVTYTRRKPRWKS